MALMLPALFPAIGQVALLVIPGIIAGITRDAELKKVALVILLTGIWGSLFFLSFDMFDAVLLLAQTASLAFILILALHYKWPGVNTLLGAFLSMAFIFVTTLGIGAGGDLIFAFSEIKKHLSKEIASQILFYKDAQPQAFPPEWEARLQELKDFIISFLPALMGIVFLFTSFLNIVIAKRFMKKVEKAYAPTFDLWKLPEYLVWLVILSGALSLFAEDYLNLIGQNGLLILASLYFIQGLSIILFYFNGLGIPRFVRIIIYILISLHWYGLLTVSIIGLVDVWFNLRSRLQPMQSNSSKV